MFAFPGMRKTTLAQKYEAVVDLEISDIKYDISSVSHLSREARKSTKRPIKDKDYKETYISKAFSFHEKGKTVLVALNFLFPMLRAFRVRGSVPFHIFIPHPSLRAKYRQRYRDWGNNDRFLFEVMLIWYPTTIPLFLLAKIFLKGITVTKAGETLEDYWNIKNT